MNKLDGKSLDIVSQNIEKIKELFPEVFSDGKINFAKLQEELGTFTEDEAERYNFTWAGKSEAKRIAQTPSTGTLRPCKEESKDWDTTQNLYIEGDNLEVLKLLQKSYHKKVKMIYIDPPYNTGKDFVYKDNFKDNIKNYLEITGQVDSEGNRLSTNSDTNGRYHSDWLNMMYPRLKLARNLLKDDGVIFISIDDNEVANLRKVCDEIFGEDNFVAEFVWQKASGNQNDNKYIAFSHEYILCFAKTKNSFSAYNLPPTKEMLNTYNLEDEFVKTRGRYYLRNLNDFSIGDRPGLHYDIKCPDGTIINGKLQQWRCDLNRFEWRLSENRIVFEKNSNDHWEVFYKQYMNETKEQVIIDENGNILSCGKTPDSMLLKIASTGDGTKDMKNVFDKNNPFSYPKPIKLINHLLTIASKNNDIILDFFSGSATTAHAVMKLNSEDGGNRKFIMVQLPEETNNKEFPTICEIGKERIRRAGEKIIGSEVLTSPKNDGLFGGTEVPPPLDIGFKVLKLDSSNIKTWDSNFENLEQNLLDSIENIKNDRTPQDLLYEILLKYGLDLTLLMEELEINGKKVFIIGSGMLVVCLDDNIDIDTVEKIAQLKKQFVEDYGLDSMRVVFKDSSFKDAVVKTNALYILKQFEIDEVVSV
ncbi:MAG: site-specific DNA-methyltransferase [Sulfurimonas sp.]|jgi:adenine-specific DNA-methyltransferase|uniref:site-specific DNA-methyltransferase n=1 Tax=Sulfurimonas sp. TaxID=2022749 RepID=UPI003561A5C2